MVNIKYIIDNGGATLNAKGQLVTYKQGYQVSKQDLCIIPVSFLSNNFITSTIRNKLEPKEFLGIWINEGKAYIDISERVTVKKQALSLGIKRKQISIFNWKNGDCVLCN